MTTHAQDSYFVRYLKKELEQRQKQNPQFSLRAFARFLNVSPAALSKILSGKSYAGEATADAILKKLNPPERQLKLLLRSLMRDEKQTSKGGKSLAPKSLYTGGFEDDHLIAISDVLHASLLELALIPDCPTTTRGIATRLQVTEHEARGAIDRLVRLNFIERLPTGKIVRLVGNFTTDAVKDRVALRLYQRQIRLQAIDAMEKVPIPERRIRGVTVAIDDSLLPEAFKLIDEFCDSLADMLQNGKQTRVYQIELGFYPVDKK